jgi:hypothetical protein
LHYARPSGWIPEHSRKRSPAAATTAATIAQPGSAARVPQTLEPKRSIREPQAPHSHQSGHLPRPPSGGLDGRALGRPVRRWNQTGMKPFPAPATGSLDGVAALAPDDVWAVDTVDAGDGSHNGVVVHWDGANWQPFDAPVAPQSGLAGLQRRRTTTSVSAEARSRPSLDSPTSTRRGAWKNSGCGGCRGSGDSSCVYTA